MDAPLGSAGLEDSVELGRLRRRAYGPDADIEGDAAAQARLVELEAAQRRQATHAVDAAATVPAPIPERVRVSAAVDASRAASISVPQPVDVAFAEQQADEGSITEHDPADGSIGDSPAAGGASAPSWWRRRRLWLILAGAIVALAMNAAVVGWLSQLLADESTAIPTETSTPKMPPVPGGLGTRPYAPAPDDVLALRSVGAAADQPNDRHRILDALGISTEELRRYEDFEGLNVWSGESRYGMACLFVAVPVQGLREGFGTDGCSPEGIGTVANLGMPDGSLVQFVLRDDHVIVSVFERATDPNASQG